MVSQFESECWELCIFTPSFPILAHFWRTSPSCHSSSHWLGWSALAFSPHISIVILFKPATLIKWTKFCHSSSWKNCPTFRDSWACSWPPCSTDRYGKLSQPLRTSLTAVHLCNCSANLFLIFRLKIASWCPPWTHLPPSHGRIFCRRWVCLTHAPTNINWFSSKVWASFTHS